MFVAISILLARFLSVENAERSELAALLQAQARGEVNAMLARLSGCHLSPACVATVRANAVSLRRRGDVKILSVKSRTSYSLGGASGKTRIAWIVLGRLPVVQCVQVRRSGNVISGIDVKLLAISAPIANEADC
ncbi:MAG: hypothetical protein E6G34_13745 [Actinobacteria bacterium]|nr:MAG: hypothetical protein E6G34_13745 [Actinomycetota bacterium]